MAFLWPTLVDANCFAVRLCGEIGERGDIIDGFEPNDDWLIAAYETDSGRILVRLGRRLKDKTKANILHLEIRPEGSFVKEPKISTQLEEIERLVQPLLGKDYNAILTGVYYLNHEDLPEIIRSMMIETEVGDVRVEMSGATFTVKSENRPVYTITWEVNEDLVQVTFQSNFTATIEPNLLSNAAKFLETSYSSSFSASPSDA